MLKRSTCVSDVLSQLIGIVYPSNTISQTHIINFKDLDSELRPQGTHYVFNLGYHPKTKDFFMFLENLVDIRNETEKLVCQLSMMTSIKSFKPNNLKDTIIVLYYAS